MVKTSEVAEILELIEATFEALKREVAFASFDTGPARNRGMLGFVISQESNQRIHQVIGKLYLHLLRWELYSKKLPATHPFVCRVNQIKADFAKIQGEIGYI